MNKWERIIIHHSASDFGTAKMIDGWHKTRGWSGIGYHFVILNGIVTLDDYRHDRRFGFLDGSVETGRPLDGDEWVDSNEIGAHALGYNKDSIGICLIHNVGIYFPAQRSTVSSMCITLADLFGISTENILGHCEVDSKKPLCPGVDMAALRKAVRRYRTVAI